MCLHLLASAGTSTHMANTHTDTRVHTDQIILLKKLRYSQVWWPLLLIPALQRQNQAVHCDSDASLVYMERVPEQPGVCRKTLRKERRRKKEIRCSSFILKRGVYQVYCPFFTVTQSDLTEVLSNVYTSAPTGVILSQNHYRQHHSSH